MILQIKSDKKKQISPAVTGTTMPRRPCAAVHGHHHLNETAVRAALVGDWRLVFTDSPPALKGGVSGLGGLPFCSSVAVLQRLSEGNPAAQCIEVVGLPLGVRNAVILKGGWTVDAEAMLLSKVWLPYQPMDPWPLHSP